MKSPNGWANCWTVAKLLDLDQDECHPHKPERMAKAESLKNLGNLFSEGPAVVPTISSLP